MTSKGWIQAATRTLLLAGGLALWSPTATAGAHGVYTFAWVEGNQICTDSYFSKNSPVRGGRISLHDPAGRELQNGLTGEDGRFCFARPDRPQDLTVAVEAGQGHRAEFRLRAEDWPAKTAPAAAEEATPPAAGPPAATTAALPAAAPAGSEEALRHIVREELEAQFGPCRQVLAESRGGGEPGVREIVGGLGWLAGLFGLAAWFSARKRRP